MSVSNEELACVYAALICHDEGIEVSADKISTIVKAASVDVQSFYPGLFAKFLGARPMGDLLTNVGGGGAAEATPAVAEAGEAAAAPEAKKEAAPPSEEDEDMGFGLFD